MGLTCKVLSVIAEYVDIEKNGKRWIWHMKAKTKWPPFADDIVKFIFWSKIYRILIQISQTFVIRGPINNTPLLVQMMAWRQAGWGWGGVGGVGVGGGGGGGGGGAGGGGHSFTFWAISQMIFNIHILGMNFEITN